MSYLNNLNPAQLEAVQQVKGPVLILAGAGSGKTMAMTYRIAYLIREVGIKPHEILAVTFTNKAAGEMRSRVEKLIPSEATSLPVIGTFHAICARFLRVEIERLGYQKNFVIYDAADQKNLVKQVMEDLKFDKQRTSPAAVLNHISTAKNELIDPVKYKELSLDHFTEIVSQVYPVYQRRLKENNALDFDDLIMKCVELFREHPEILDKYQERFKFINVDEYQDTNHAQYTWVRLLAEKYRNICVVGDDWQSIYRWRGADMRNILNFESDYPEAKKIKLEQNYRSTQTILDAAHAIIEKNQKRTDKKLWTECLGGDSIKIIEATDERHEGDLITQEIESQGGEYRDYVVLYRTNAQSRALEEAFLRAGIPYKIVGGIKFYERKEIKDVLAYLHLILNSNDNLAFERILNVPARKIGKTSFEKLHKTSQQLKQSLFEFCQQQEVLENLLGSTAKRILDFVKLIKELQKKSEKLTASKIIELALNKTGYRNYLLDGTAEGEERFENVEELLSVSSKYDELKPIESLASFLEEVALITDLDQVNEEDNAVTLMTLHAAKGLEFRVVFMAGLEENIMPHSRSQTDPEEAEEERRLCYVGITRAKDQLYMIASQQRMLWGSVQFNQPSRYLSELPAELVEYHSSYQESTNIRGIKDSRSGEIVIPNYDRNEHKVKRTKDAKAPFSDGEKVTHPSFGKGIVVEVKGDIVTVAFKKAGIKKLVASVAPLTLAS
ncbi:MAG: UvrD-helicase domain-containing protein [Candidatus Gracilibacteria bacterium]|nr:UvrD-helicase domain-containing protein [Candidatus Gracilibacteria bacterium]